MSVPFPFRRSTLLRATATTAASATELTARAAAIQRKERTLWWLRALVVPGFIVYGLVVLRPTEGHFLRYLAERRHLEPPFNRLFPPLTRAELTDGRDITGATAASSGNSPATSSAAKDKTWLQKKFHIDVTEKEDEERVARKRLLFARDRSFSESFSDEYGVVLVKPAEERQLELELLAEHPPMHALREQLDQLADASHAYHKAKAETAEVGDPSRPIVVPALELQFRDRALFATAAMVFRNPAGEEVNRMRFVGVCGMMWKQITS